MAHGALLTQHRSHNDYRPSASRRCGHGRREGDFVRTFITATDEQPSRRHGDAAGSGGHANDARKVRGRGIGSRSRPEWARRRSS